MRISAKITLSLLLLGAAGLLGVAPHQRTIFYGQIAGAGGGPGTPPTLVSHNQSSGGSTSPLSLGAGHLLLVIYSVNPANDVTAVTDTGPLCTGGTASWVHVAPMQSTNTLNEFWGAWMCPSSSGTASSHLSFTTAGTVKSNMTLEISGSSAYDATACTTSGVTTMPSVTTTGADLLVIAVASSSGTIIFSGSWTVIGSSSTYNFEYYLTEQQASPGSYGATASGAVQGCIFSVKQ